MCTAYFTEQLNAALTLIDVQARHRH